MAPNARTSGSNGQPGEVTADVSGRFTVELPHGGAWRVTGAARGFRGQDYDAHDGFFSAVVLIDTAPEFSLTFRLVPDSVVTGLVLDEAGEPVESAQVMAELVPEPDPGIPATANRLRPRASGASQTDDRGRYEIGGLAPGNYRLRVQARPWYAVSGRGVERLAALAGQPQAATPPPDPPLDFVYAATWFPGADDESGAQLIALGPGEERQADFHLSAVPSVHLKVPAAPPEQTQQNGRARPQQAPQVFVSRMASDSASGNQTLQGVYNGREWDFGGLTSGSYEVRVSGPGGRGGGEPQLIEVSGSEAVLSLDSARAMIQVTLKMEGVKENEAASVEFIDTESGRRITANPPGRGRRGGFPGGGGPPGADESFGPEEEASHGGWTVRLPPRTYEVFVNDTNGYLTGISAAGAKVAGRTVTIDGPATVTLHLASGRATLDGMASLDGKPAQGAMVLLVPATLGQPGDFSSVQREETNTDGTFAIAGIPPGLYILVVIDHGWSVAWRRPETLAQYLLKGTPIDLRGAAKRHEEVEAITP